MAMMTYGLVTMTYGLVTPLTPSNITDLTDISKVVVEEGPLYSPWNNPNNVITFQTFLTYEKVMNCGVNLLLFVVGVPTNIVNCVVFYRQGLKDRMNLCLFCLAVADMMYIVFFYLIGSYCLVGSFFPEVEEWWKFFARKYFTGVYRGFLYLSGCLTMVISVERCMCVLMPLKAVSLIRTRSVAMVIVGLALTIHCACLLYPLQLSIGSTVDEVTGQVSFFLTSSHFYYEYKLLYDVLENVVLMVLLPFVTFIVVTMATTITVIQLKRTVAWRQDSGTGSGDATGVREKALIKMLVIVSIIFIVASAPNIALGVTRLVVREFHHTRKYANIFLASHLTYLVLALVNSSVNFFVYWARSSKFRQELLLLLRACGQHHTHSGQAKDKQLDTTLVTANPYT